MAGKGGEHVPSCEYGLEYFQRPPASAAEAEASLAAINIANKKHLYHFMASTHRVSCPIRKRFGDPTMEEARSIGIELYGLSSMGAANSLN